MSSRMSGMRDRAVNAALGVELRKLLLGFQDSLARNERHFEVAEKLERQFDELSEKIVAQGELLRVEAAIRKYERDNIAGLRTALEALRETQAYDEAFAVAEPLVSVRIASYQRTEELIDVAIASVLAQSYERFEVIVVNDGPNDATRAAVAGLGDPRIRYDEFARRNVYPDDAHSRWMVAGSPGMNRGAQLATGTWIAPLDEDDAFTPDHIERLLTLAQERRVELAYGALEQRNLVNGTSARIFSNPPEISQFSFQGSIYLGLLKNTFRYDESSWVVQEPGDWNLVRRMKAAGVTMAATEEVVAVMNQIPYTHKPLETAVEV